MEDIGASANGAPTIWKVLANDICRREILDYVPIRDLVRSERVCKAWQHAVYDYLEHRCALTVDVSRRCQFFCHRTVNIPYDCPPAVFRKTIEKVGPSVVSVSTDRCDKEFFETLESECPQLRHLEFKYVYLGRPHVDTSWFCSVVERDISEQQLDQTYQNIECETDKTVKREGMPGSKLNNLKSLSLIDCQSLDFAYLYLRSYLRNITSLELDKISTKSLTEVHLLLDQMQGVESVSLRCNNRMFPDRGETEEIIKCFGRLSRLRSLKMIMNYGAYDALLEALARDCKRLEYLHIAGHGLITCGRGLAALVLRAPAAVTTLNFIQEMTPKEIKYLLKNLKAYGCGDVMNDSVHLQGLVSPLKISLGPAVGTVQLPELKITLDSLGLDDYDFIFKILLHEWPPRLLPFD